MSTVNLYSEISHSISIVLDVEQCCL